MMKIGAVADHFADAASFGVSLAKTGARTAVIFDAAAVEDEHTLCGFDAVSVSANLNSFSHEEVLHDYRAAAKILRESGVQQVSLKIDPTPDRETLTKISAMLDALGSDSVAVVVPPVSEFIPTAEANYKPERSDESELTSEISQSSWFRILRSVAGQSEQNICRVGAEDLTLGKEQIKKALIGYRQEKNRILIMDAVTKENMEEAVWAVAELDWNVLLVDSGVFTAKLAYRKGLISNPASAEAKTAIPPKAGTALVIDGSTSPTAQRQMEVLFAHNDVDHIAVNTGLLTKPDDNAEYEIKRVTRSVTEAIQSDRPPRTMVVDTALCGKMLDLPAEDHKNHFQKGTCAYNIKNSLGRIVTKIIHDAAEKLIGIYITGDETITAVCSHLGVKAIELTDAVLPQAAAGHLIGTSQELPIIWNKGGTGSEYTAEDLVNRLFLTASKGLSS